MLSLITYITNPVWYEAVLNIREALVYFGLGALARGAAGYLYGRE